jgi:hypothetical protein
MAVFWVVVPYCLVGVYQWFRGSCCLHYQDDHASRFYQATQCCTQKTAIFFSCIFTTIAWNEVQYLVVIPSLPWPYLISFECDSSTVNLSKFNGAYHTTD